MVMKKIFLLFSVAAALIFTSCNSDSRPTVLNNVVCILNQGNYSQHNGSIYLYDETTKSMSENVFFKSNNYELGATIMDGIYNSYGIGYILCSNPDKIEIIDITNGRSATDPITDEDGGLRNTRELTLGENYIFVSNAGEDYVVDNLTGAYEYTNSFVSIYNAYDNELVKKIEVGSDAQDLIYANSKLYVATKDGIVVIRCDGNDNFAIEDTFKDEEFAGPVKYLSFINNVIYASIPGKGIWAVSPTGKTVNTYPVTLGYDGYLFTDANNNIWTIVTDYAAGTSNIYKFDTKTGNYESVVPAGQDYYSVGVSPVTGNVYYSEANGYTSNSTLFVYDQKNDQVIDTKVAGVGAYRYLFFSYLTYADEQESAM